MTVNKNKYKPSRNKNNYKKSAKNTKKSIKNTQKLHIFKDFVDWLNGIQEDDPMPFEVEYIYFVLDFSQNDIVFSYSGDENTLPLYDLGFYAPLEGQYFDCGVIKEISKDIFENKKNELKKQVFELLKSIVFENVDKFWFLKNKKVFYGIKYQKINYKYAL